MQTRRVVRAEQWWNPKLAPLVGIAALAIGASPGPAPVSAIGDLVLLVASMIGVAAFGHVVNDLYDIDADAAGGKPNRMAALGHPARVAAVVASLLLGLLPWIWLDARPSALVALAVEVGLLFAYSAPPIRLKARSWAGALADAGYAFAIPFVIVVLALGPDQQPQAVLLIGVLAAWGLLLGLRGIVWHQIADAEADRAAQVGTLARRLGSERAERLLSRILLPAELILLGLLIVLADVAWLPWLALAFVAYRTFQVTFLWTEPLVPATLRGPRQVVAVVGFEYVNVFIERWVPLAALVSLAMSPPSASSWWWVVVAVYFLAFRNAVRTFLSQDMWVIPDGIERLAYARAARRDIELVEQQRIERLAAGPVPLDDRAARRFVFVVCGPSSHIETLSTALRHLRPVTEAEIWVLTDTARNAAPIADGAIDQIVDITTPAGLDDHQASIWLKTSVHRHLPAGEWCYLDSDIIAVDRGVEEVFDHRSGPVAFASDVTILENSVDRFSPWAMTCPCVGYDDEHSCSHLREQLQVRFDLEVPGDWLHWNGGVFVFGTDSGEVLDMWHERAVESFGWPEWKTRDQGALIATVWTLGLQDLARLPPTFNFIADLGNHDLCLDVERGWAHHPSGPWWQARMLHLYTSALEDPSWSLGRDVEAVVLGRSHVRISRYERGEMQAKAKHSVVQAGRNVRWTVQNALEVFVLKARNVPRRLTPARISRAIRWRLGRDVSDVPIPNMREPEPQRASDRRA